MPESLTDRLWRRDELRRRTRSLLLRYWDKPARLVNRIHEATGVSQQKVAEIIRCNADFVPAMEQAGALDAVGETLQKRIADDLARRIADYAVYGID